MQAKMAQTGSWFLIQSKPRQGTRAEQNLINQGYRCYFPRICVDRLRGGRRQQVREALFPGYLFVYLRPGADSWQPIRSTRGVQRLVTFDNKPVPVADDIINSIRVQIDQRESARPALFRTGEMLRITRGPFADVQAIFQGFDGEERVVVLLELMHRRQRLVIQMADVAAG
ncbi:transcription/translation regulatory transformer protein RfaH [Alcanivorax sp. JB21]|uniref:transcription/translation regulatory transformer protein RfaH n=1 Tax=Alcanivorax limicola TaxID=2874102 RepID=UPI001CBCA9E0|nr:transcription/translation regulatory transformer protein RfaH [Alcanivorax limicola]MBZ2188149.1 transcription/translation regulatory transformer protein RfaH [Alcanivorax limicola]